METADFARQLLQWSGAGGLPALFLLSFLAATLVPLGSEWLLVALLLEGREPVAVVAVATAGNLLGAMTTWLIGRQGGEWLMRRVLRIDGEEQRRAERLYGRYGRWTLLFSWLPLLGDPLCLVAGVLRVEAGSFLLLAGLGKFGRYALLAGVTLGLAG